MSHTLWSSEITKNIIRNVTSTLSYLQPRELTFLKNFVRRGIWFNIRQRIFAFGRERQPFAKTWILFHVLTRHMGNNSPATHMGVNFDKLASTNCLR